MKKISLIFILFLLQGCGENTLSVSSGFFHSCRIEEGEDRNYLWCWGRNIEGQLGKGDYLVWRTYTWGLNSEEWVKEKWSSTDSVSAGGYHTCAIDDDKNLWCWGRNDYGQVGNGENENKNIPSPVSFGKKWKSVSAGGHHTCAIDDDKNLWCWGRNNFGQLGNGGYKNENIPVLISQDKRWNQVSAGGHHTCAIDDEKKLWCWGRNDFGQVGDESFENRNRPVIVSLPDGKKKWLSVSAGGYHTCAIDDEKKLWCWGRNDFGQLGDGGNENKNVPSRVADRKWKSVSSGGYHTCAIDGDHNLWCWGRNDFGQIGDESFEKRNRPVIVFPPRDVKKKKWLSVSSGGYHTCAVIEERRRVYCWGSDSYGQCGVNHRYGRRADFWLFEAISSPVQVGKDKDWAFVSTSLITNCAIKDDGTLWCWGSGLCNPSPFPKRIGNDTDWVYVLPNRTEIYGIKRDKTLWYSASEMWTDEGTQIFCIDDTAPMKQIGRDKDWVSVSCGVWNEPCWMMKEDGSIWKFTSPDKMEKIYEGWHMLSNVSCYLLFRGCRRITRYGIKEDGTLWGFIKDGGLKQVGTENDWEFVDMGYAIKSDGSLWRLKEVIEFLEGEDKLYILSSLMSEGRWKMVSSGVVDAPAYEHSCAIKEDGTLWCWVIDWINTDGEIVQPMTPVSNDRWIFVSNSTFLLGGIICGIKEDKTLWCWGNDMHGSLGIGPPEEE